MMTMEDLNLKKNRRGHEGKVIRRYQVYGIVQGVGFRPTVARHAAASQISGHVSNKGPYVEILAAGSEEEVTTFRKLLEEQPPKRSVILKIDQEEVGEPSKEDSDLITQGRFEIIESAKTKGQIFISPDIAICDDCKRELFDPKDRRYLHPFINCTCCGPRLTILDHLPYDRKRTSMKHFPMCTDCEKEYYGPESRRYDAQPVCCNHCGPEVYLYETKDIDPKDEGGIDHADLIGKSAISRARAILSSGGILAVKGIGGFHLCCDATNEVAVQTLRERKPRPSKPLAVMMKNESVVRRECQLAPNQEEILCGHQKPILLLPKKEGGKICPGTAPDNPFLGVMLPYAPIQLLLFDYPDGISVSDCLVMTSGNVSGAPICRTDADAISQLSRMCDAILSNNRPIVTRADDTVLDFYHGSPYMIRRSRGYAPLPVLMEHSFRGNVLAVGGELKNTFVLGVGELFYPSAYVGDLSDVRTVQALRAAVTRMEELLETQPDVIVSDLHPGYQSTALAKVLADQSGILLYQVQHHYAHVVSCMAENDYLSPTIGLSFDGTGFGSDGTIWGGEVLLADPLRKGVEVARLASIVPFWQIGGDLASREGWRIAVSMIYGLYKRGLLAEDPSKVIEVLELCSSQVTKAQFAMYDHRLNAVRSTSMGRLFDGAAAILGIKQSQTFEGEAANALEFAALRYEKKRSDAMEDPKDLEFTYPLLREEDRLLLSTDHLMAELTSSFLAGIHEQQDLDREGDISSRKLTSLQEFLAWKFHQGLSLMALEACRKVREKTGLSTVALSGGCYQNTLLLKLTEEKLLADGFQVLRHHLIPPNDGGIALGQAVIADCQRALEEV